ncbi:MAG TPA: methyltransferase domain-containing protein [Fimbriimonadaceae bacterium]|nr:methyltransferase domain-containing protein [Fimbriimonadaceae bacterium]
MELGSMMQPVDWKAFFDAHAPHYMENVFTKWTTTEVQFLLDLFQLPSGASILDLGCGTGRHSIELARRGFDVTGVDLSSGMLAEARKAAQAAGVEVEWIEADATQYRTDKAFDAAICLCEGGFGLIGAQEDPVMHDLGILQTAFAALRPGAPFLLTALNGYSIIRQMKDEHVQEGRFDPATMMAAYVDEMKLPEGAQRIFIRERLFIPPEVVAMMRHAGFVVEHVWGGTAGEWGKRPLKLDEIEAMYVARKP